MDRTERLLELIATDKTPRERAICEAAFHAILAGRPAHPARLAAASGIGIEVVRAVLDRLVGRGLLVVDGGGRVVGSWGLSAQPTAHWLQMRGTELFTWCAFDAVGIPAFLGEDASVSSKCGQCRAPVAVDMVAGQISRATPTDTVLWLAAEQRGRSVVGYT